jgi:hypothetical protein
MLSTKSLNRLERLRKRLGLTGQVVFEPEHSLQFRYSIISKPLGKDARDARKALKELASAGQKA